MAAPQHKVTFFPLRAWADKASRELPSILKTDSVDLAPYINKLGEDLSGLIVSIQTDKSCDQLQPGRFILRLTNSGKAKLVQVGDLFQVTLNAGLSSKSPSIVVMLGLVVRIARTVRIGNDQASQFVEIHGQDLARWLYVDRNFFYAYAGIGAAAADGIVELQRRQKIWEFLFPSKGEPDLPSVKILDNILTGYIGAILPRVGEVVKFEGVRTQSNQATFKGEEPVLGFGEKYLPHTTLSSYTGAVANLLLEHSLEYLAELWCDTTDGGGFKVYYRRKPFDQSDWDSFKPDGQEIHATRILHHIPDALIAQADLGRSEEEYYNFISILPWVYAANTDVMPLLMKSGLRLDRSAIWNRGLRPLITSSPYLDRAATQDDLSLAHFDSFDDLIKSGTFTNESVKAPIPLTQVESILNTTLNARGRLAEVADDWASAMWRWYSQLDRYLEGRITVQGNPAIRVGHQVELPCETGKFCSFPYKFYVVDVSHDYNVEEGRYLTSLVLKRGQPSDAFLLPVTDGREDISELDAAKLAPPFKNIHVLGSQPFKALTVEITPTNTGGQPVTP